MGKRRLIVRVADVQAAGACPASPAAACVHCPYGMYPCAAPLSSNATPSCAQIESLVVAEPSKLTLLPSYSFHTGRAAGGAARGAGGDCGLGWPSQRQDHLLCRLLRGQVQRRVVALPANGGLGMPCHAPPCPAAAKSGHPMSIPCHAASIVCLPLAWQLMAFPATSNARLRARDQARHCRPPPLPHLQPAVHRRRTAAARHPGRWVVLPSREVGGAARLHTCLPVLPRWCMPPPVQPLWQLRASRTVRPAASLSGPLIYHACSLHSTHGRAGAGVGCR